MSKPKKASQEPAQTTLPAANLVEIVIPAPAPITDGQQLLDTVSAFAVTDADSYAQLAGARQNARARWAAIEKQRKDMKEPSLEAGRRVDAFFKPVLAVFEKAGLIATAKLSDYDAEQRKIAAEKQRQADEEARRQREAAEQREREEAARQAEIKRQQEIAAAQAREAEERRKREEAEAREAEERARREAAEAAAAGDKARAEKAEQEANEERQRAVAARMAQLRAEERIAEQERQTEAALAESRAREAAAQAEAQTAVAPVIEAEIVQVAGLSRAKTYAWRLLDKSKLKPEYLLVDEKAINALVRSTRQRAAEMVGAGAIEVYEDTTLRQR